MCVVRTVTRSFPLYVCVYVCGEDCHQVPPSAALALLANYVKFVPNVLPLTSSSS